jgi:hypothetical protein
MKGRIMSIDITSFDAVKSAGNPIKVEMKHPDGSPTGVTFSIIGKNADPVIQLTKKYLRKMQSDEVLAKRRGKPVEPSSVEELEEQGIDLASVRVVGWDGVKQSFDVNLLKSVLRKNPHWVQAIIDESNDDGNFTTAS